jgi:hypothetical protein
MLTMENGLLFIEAALFGRLIRFSLRSKRTESVVEREENGGKKRRQLGLCIRVVL